MQNLLRTLIFLRIMDSGFLMIILSELCQVEQMNNRCIHPKLKFKKNNNAKFVRKTLSFEIWILNYRRLFSDEL